MNSVSRLVWMVAVAAAGAAACNSAQPSVNAQVREAAQPAAAQTVEVVAVTSDRLHAIVPLPGELAPYETVAIYSKVTGFVRGISVDRGSHVRRGETIARLEAPELVSQRAEAQAKLQGAQAQLAAAEAKLASDEATYQRLKSAAATPGVVAGNDLEIAQRTAEADRAQTAAEQQNVAAARQSLQSVAEIAGYLDVKAPFDGVVTERNVHPGALVGPSGAATATSPIVRIESVDRLRLVVPVPESYVAGVTEGRAVDFTVQAYPGRTFTGKVARLAHSVTVKTRTMPVELDVENTNHALTAGGFAEVRWLVERPDASLFIPPSSVATTLERTFVVRVRNGKAEWVNVTTGVNTGKLVEVFGDLRAGDQVAVRGTDELKPGTNVAPRAPTR